MASKEEILEGILQLPVLDVSWLVKELEEKFGVTAAVPVAAVASAAVASTAPAAGSDSASDSSSEEQSDFTVTLQDIGASKINVIKAVREVTTLGLKEARDFVESAPAAVKEGASKEEADDIKSKLEAAGASVTLS